MLMNITRNDAMTLVFHKKEKRRASSNFICNEITCNLTNQSRMFPSVVHLGNESYQFMRNVTYRI